MHDFSLDRPFRFRRDGSPYPEGNEGLFEWARDFEDLRKRVVRRSYSLYGEGLSTVWLGLDHSFLLGPPLIFESMVFSRGVGREMWRWSTEQQAVRGHKRLHLQMLVPPFLRRRFFEEWR